MFLCKLNLVFILFAKMIPKDIVNFSFSSWYPTFKHLTFESKIIGLSDEAIAYLRQDGILLPSGVDPHNSSRRPPADDTEGDEDISENEWPETEWSSSDEEDAVEPWVLDLKKVVDEAIRALGGDVFPKLNWSSPKDACWILPNRKLKCSSLSDILLLLKSSTFISYDLSVKIQEQKPVPLEMVLRQWSEINPGWEFRCFVKDKNLIGISQRHTSAFYPHVMDDPEGLTKEIKAFFQRSIKESFLLKDYTFDIVTFTSDRADFRLVDFNPFDSVTDPGLFTWDELLEANSIPDKELLRGVAFPLAIQPDEMRQYEVPADLLDSRFTTNGRSLFDFLGKQINGQDVDNSDEEELN